MSDLHKSEVARFRELQALEEESLRMVFSGFAITARHDYINARMQRGGEHILQLIAEGKHEEAQTLMNSDTWGVAVAKGKGRKKKSHA